MFSCIKLLITNHHKIETSDYSTSIDLLCLVDMEKGNDPSKESKCSWCIKCSSWLLAKAKTNGNIWHIEFLNILKKREKKTAKMKTSKCILHLDSLKESSYTCWLKTGKLIGNVEQMGNNKLKSKFGIALREKKYREKPTIEKHTFNQISRVSLWKFTAFCLNKIWLILQIFGKQIQLS